MKKTLTILAAGIMMLLGIQAYAQPKVELGYLNSTLKSDLDFGDISGSDNGNGFYIGFKYGIPVSYDQKFVFEPGLMFDFLSFDGSSMTYLRAPIHLNYNIELAPDTDFFFGAGPGLVLGLSGDDDVYDSDYGVLKRFNLQLGLEIGLRFASRYEVRVGYNWGVLDIADGLLADFGDAHQHNLHIGVGYVF